MELHALVSTTTAEAVESEKPGTRKVAVALMHSVNMRISLGLRGGRTVSAFAPEGHSHRKIGFGATGAVFEFHIDDGDMVLSYAIRGEFVQSSKHIPKSLGTRASP
jgi:hypothetical protein